MYFKLEQIVYDGRRCARIGFGKFRREQWDAWVSEMKRSRTAEEQAQLQNKIGAIGKTKNGRGLVYDGEKEDQGG